MPPDTDRPASILFIVVSRIGDTLFATPMIRAVATAWPEARITVLGHPKRAEVLHHIPFIHKVGTITKGRARWRGHFGRKSYDLALVTGNDLPLIAYSLRIAHRVVAFAQGSPSLDQRLAKAVPQPELQSDHAVRLLLRLPAALGISPVSQRLCYQVTAEEKTVAIERLRAHGLDNGNPKIGLQVASFPTKAYRDWPVEYFAALCKRIMQHYPTSCFAIFGGPVEQERTHWLAQQLDERAVLFAGRLTLRETAAVMSEMDCYVGVDTGPTHIMSSFDIPIIGLYHCLSARAHTGPLNHPLDFCLDHPQTGMSCNDSTPMTEISVDQVMHQVELALEAGRQ